MPRAALALLLASALTPGAPQRASTPAQPPAAAPFADPVDPRQRELALAVLERSSRPFAVYCARSGRSLTIVVELSAAAIQTAQWTSGADIEAVAASADGVPVAKSQARLEAGVYAASMSVTWKSDAAPDRVTVTITTPDGKPVDEWVRLYPPSGALVGEPLVWRSANRIAPRPVAAFEFARNERARVEWPLPGSIDRRAARLLNRSGRVLVTSLTLTEDPVRRVLVLDLAMSNLIHGDYLVELEAASGSVTERHLLAVRTR